MVIKRSSIYNVIMFALLQFATFSGELYAGEHKITNPYDAQSPYLIVTEESGTINEKEPGIYSVTPDGSYQLLVAGKVLRKGANLGVLEHLNLSTITQRHEAIVVIDGDLYLVQQSNREHEPSEHSFIKIGGAELPVIDPLSKEEIQIPRIHDVEDAVVYSELHSDSQEEILLISLREKLEVSKVGDGITIALNLKAKTSEKPWSSVQTNHAYLLDHRFRSKSSLSSLINRNDGQAQRQRSVYSTRLLNYYNRAQTRRNRVTNPWLRRLEDAARQLDSAHEGQNLNDKDLPSLSLVSGSVVLSELPKYTLKIDGQIQLVQYIDPVNGQDKLKITGSFVDGARTEIRGRFDVGSDDYPLFADTSDSSTKSAVIVVDGELYFIHSRSSGTAGPRNLTITRLGTFAALPTGLAAFSREMTDSSGTTTYYLLISSEDQGTMAFVLRDQYDSLLVEKKLFINDEHYRSFELQLRTHDSNYKNDGHLLFDHITKVEVDLLSEAAYEQNHNPQEPILDLTSTTERRKVYSPVKALGEIQVSPGVRYNIFKRNGSKVTKGALGIEQEHKVHKEIEGELLRAKGINGEIRPDWLTSTFQINQQMSASIAITALDSTYRGGQSNFNLVTTILLNSIAVKDEVSPHIVFEEAFAEPIEHLHEIALLKPGKNVKYAQLFLSFKNPNNGNGALYVKTIEFPELSPNGPKDKLPSMLTKIQLADEFVPIEVARQRSLLSITNGEFYWVTTPEMSSSSEGYLLKPFNRSEEIELNSSQGRQLKLVTIEQFESASKTSHDFEASQANWEISNLETLRKLLKDRGYPVLEQVPSLASEKQKLMKAINDSFPNLQKTLNDFANFKEEPKHLLILTGKNNKPQLMSDLATTLEISTDSWAFHGHGSKKQPIRPFFFRQDRNSLEAFTANLRITANSNRVIIADGKDLIQTNRVVPRNEIRDSDALDAKKDPHALAFLAREGNEKLNDDKKQNRIIAITSIEEYNTLMSQMLPEEREDFERSFEINRDYFSLGWRAWPTYSKNAKKRHRELLHQVTSQSTQAIIPDVLDKLNTLADLNRDPEHVVLIVPDDLVSFVNSVVISSWVNADPQDKSKLWSQYNEQLYLHEYSTVVERNKENTQRTTQDEILRELEAVRSRTKQRSVLLVHGSDLVGEQNERIMAATNDPNISIFYISDSAEKFVANNERTVPHTLYLLSNEGHKRSLEDYQNLPSGSSHATASIVVIASEREWNTIKARSGIEQRYGLLEHFRIESITPPTAEVKLNIIEGLLKSPEIAQLNFTYIFDQKQTSDERRRLLNYLISRSEALAKQYKREPIEAFVGVIDQLKQTLIYDVEVRRTRIVSKDAIERTLSKAFGLALNLNTLAQDDHLRKLNNTASAARAIQEAGWHGSLEMRRKFVRVIASQTKTSGGAIAIPSSMILYGDTGTGKTFLWKSLIKSLGLKERDWSLSDEENIDAEALVVEFNRIIPESENSDADSRRAKGARYFAADVIKQIESFIASPKGFRGFLLLDDVHKAPPKERWQVLSYIQGLLENGTVVVKDGSSRRTVSLRNFNIAMTLNPVITSSSETNEKEKTLSTEDRIIQTLKDKDCPIDHSALKRWAAILNLSKVDPNAVFPALHEKVSLAAKEHFNVTGQLVLSHAKALRAVATRFQITNFRELLGSATANILAIASTVSEPGLKLIVPNSITGRKDSTNSYNSFASSDRDSEKISSYVNQSLTSVSGSSENLESQLYLLSIVTDSVRTSLFESLVTAATAHDVLAQEGQEQFLASFLNAVNHRFTQHPFIPLTKLHLSAKSFLKASSSDSEAIFKEVVSHLDEKGNEGFIPAELATLARRANLYQRFTDHTFSEEQINGVREIIDFYTKQVKDISNSYFYSLFQLPTQDFPDDIAQWINSLKTPSSHRVDTRFGDQLIDLFLRFIHEVTLTTSRTSETTPTLYDLSHLFLITIDRSLLSLPWAAATKFLSTAIERISAEADLAQHPGVQDFFFDQPYSPVRTAVHERVFQIVTESEAFSNLDQASRHKQIESFGGTCEQLFN